MGRINYKGQGWKQGDQWVKEKDAGFDHSSRIKVKMKDKDEGYYDWEVHSMWPSAGFIEVGKWKRWM